MKATFFNELKEELKKGASDKGHPFRYCTLATVGLDNIARLRTIVLRKATEDLMLTFFTDKRSKKVVHIKENQKVSLLFYHPEKLMQIRIEGLAVVNNDIKSKKLLWDSIPEASRKDYTTSEAPGKEIKDPDVIEYLKDEDHFCIVEIHPFKIEYLKLKRPNHIRVRYSKNKTDWEGDFLVP
ncbi:pyridoxamine 5'-phosphate oxidase family protein [Sediminicola sp. 1XM1-17]|uniref:pyridoxamine 5'-phosphate oxidase family protein n=1 Tax=Sediminicola sp. 1XM1-17 TaxID=3127702 RepID=UPI003077E4F2